MQTNDEYICQNKCLNVNLLESERNSSQNEKTLRSLILLKLLLCRQTFERRKDSIGEEEKSERKKKAER